MIKIQSTLNTHPDVRKLKSPTFNLIPESKKANKWLGIEDFKQYANIAHYLERSGFSFAKTMPKFPHWYTHRDRSYSTNREEYLKTIKFILDNGYRDDFFRSPRMKMNINGWGYFPMVMTHAEAPESFILNRALLDFTDPYDSVAELYDEVYDSEECKKENEEIRSAILSLIFDKKFESMDVLDIGCGTGLLIDIFKGVIYPQNYIGLDPSIKMIDRFKQKHPSFSNRLMVCKFEEFWYGRFDVAISTFGSLNYCRPEVMERIPLMLSKGGVAFVMVYNEKHTPAIHSEGIEKEEFTYDDSVVKELISNGWEKETFKNYHLLTYQKI